MSTKASEACPKCNTAVMPTDRVVVYGGDVPCKPWRYECSCGWTWANAAQRKHNDHAYNKAYKWMKQREEFG